MCGIAGLLRWDGLQADDAPRVRAAAETLAHRGPDGAGFWRDERIALGFRRLKIIDLSPAGEQPMANEDGSLHVVFNGEIYNFRELRAELEGQGHVFKSRSDTEVLLHLYEELGEAMLPRLRGMFAFAIWDSRHRKLFLARDPLGVKPLYFAERAGFLAFASEPKALFALGVKPELDPVALDEALTYRYVPAPRSGFKDVEKLPPGHCAAAENGTLNYRRWFELPVAQASSLHQGRQDACATDELEARLNAARERRGIADVPIGWWLSGGIDSALARPAAAAESFCAGFDQPEYDERALAHLSAQALHSARHHEFSIAPDVFRTLPQIVWHADEPFFDSSCLPTYALAEQTKAFASVVFSGDGGDESFAGYERYAGMKLLRRFKQVPSPLRKIALNAARKKHSRQGWDRSLRWLENCRQVEESGHHPYLAAMELFTPEQKSSLYGEAMLEATDGCDAREYLEQALRRADPKPAAGAVVTETRNPKPVSILQRADLETYLPGDVLHKVDRMSMAHGVEVRSPFLDVDLVAWALSLPDNIRLPRRTTKPLLRAAAARVLPKEVVKARKRGFGVPLDDWFRGGLREPARAIFEDSALVADKLFHPRYWETLWQEHAQERAQHGERLYALLALEVWYRMFISGEAPRTRPGLF